LKTLISLLGVNPKQPKNKVKLNLFYYVSVSISGPPHGRKGLYRLSVKLSDFTL